MPSPAVPVKTPLGHDELRHRTQRLGQRYRTVLLLVDGRRSLAEVLDLARKAGVQSSYLEELVSLGLVELPPETVPGAPSLPAATVVDVPDQEALAPVAEVAAEPEHVAVPAIEVVTPLPHPQPDAPAERPVASALAAPARRGEEPAVADAVAAAPDPSLREERLLEDVRKLLLATLRRDTLLSRAFAAGRVRSAQTQDELIALVWEIERERAHARRTRGQLLNLQRARELLGMGNTLVADDGLPGPPSVP